MKQYLILLAAVVAMAIPAGCERSGAEDDREFDSKTDGLRFRLGTDSISTSLGADQTELHRVEANRARAAVVKKEKPKTSPGTGTKTGTGTETGPGTETGTETGTGTGTEKSAIDSDGIVDGEK